MIYCMLLQICFTGDLWHREHVNGFALACTLKWYLRWDVVPKLRSHNLQTCERILLCVRFTCEFKMDWVANDLLQRPQACSFPLCICIWHFIPRYVLRPFPHTSQVKADFFCCCWCFCCCCFWVFVVLDLLVCGKKKFTLNGYWNKCKGLSKKSVRELEG